MLSHPCSERVFPGVQRELKGFQIVYREQALHSTSNLSFQLRLVSNISGISITFSYFPCVNIHLRCEKGQVKSPLDGSSMACALWSWCLCRACLTSDAKHVKRQTWRGFVVCRTGSATSCVVWYPRRGAGVKSVMADAGELLYGHCWWLWWLLYLLCHIFHPKRLALVLWRAARLPGLCLIALGSPFHVSGD